MDYHGNIPEDFNPNHNDYNWNLEINPFDQGSKELGADMEIFPLHSTQTTIKIRKKYAR